DPPTQRVLSIQAGGHTLGPELSTHSSDALLQFNSRGSQLSLPPKQGNSVLPGAMLCLSGHFRISLDGAGLRAQSSARLYFMLLCLFTATPSRP
ncbi:Imidazolonepropionase, partial [Dissostichus eleginoides]